MIATSHCSIAAAHYDHMYNPLQCMMAPKYGICRQVMCAVWRLLWTAVTHTIAVRCMVMRVVSSTPVSGWVDLMSTMCH